MIRHFEFDSAAGGSQCRRYSVQITVLEPNPHDGQTMVTMPVNSDDLEEIGQLLGHLGKIRLATDER